MTVNSIIALSLASFLCVSRAGADATTQPDSASQDNAELRGEVDQLKAKVDQLETNQQPSPPAPAIPDTNQSAFHAFHFTSGYDPAVGFVIRSDDGLFSLHPGIVMDFRNMTSYREELLPNSGSEVPKPGDSTENGFDLTRFRLTFDGRVTQNITYFVQLQDDQGQTFGLLDAYWAYHFGKDSPFAIKVGQFKDPVWHERNLSEADLLGGGPVAGGIAPRRRSNRPRPGHRISCSIRIACEGNWYSTMDSTAATPNSLTPAAWAPASEPAPASRRPTSAPATAPNTCSIGDRTPNFNPYTEYDKQFTALGDKQDILVAGGGADFSQASSNDVLFHTVDLQYDTTCGFSAYAAYLASYRDLHAAQGVTKGYLLRPRIRRSGGLSRDAQRSSRSPDTTTPICRSAPQPAC